MPLQPNLIANHRIGLELDLDPWLLPADAYREMTNWHLWQGQVVKRKGYTLLGSLPQAITFLDENHATETDGTLALTKPTGTAEGHLLVAIVGAPTTGAAVLPSGWTSQYDDYTGSCRLVIATKVAGSSEGASYDFSFDGYASNISGIIAAYDGINTADPIESVQSQKNAVASTNLVAPSVTTALANSTVLFCGMAYNASAVTATPPAGYDERADASIDNCKPYLADDIPAAAGATGSKTAVLSLSSVSIGVQIALNPYAADQFPVMGMFNYNTSAGTQELLAFSLRRAFAYRSDVWEDVSGSDQFTGTTANFFWMTNWLDDAYITNGKDKVHVYNGTASTPMTIDAGGVDVKGPYAIIPWKNRLILFSTIEDGVRKAQRARWSDINLPGTWSATSYVDAPTAEWIQGACFLKNDLLVFFDRSIWKLAYTGDSRMPFTWLRVASSDGTVSPYSIVDFESEVIAMGSTRVIATDGLNIYPIDKKIPRLILDMNQSKLGLVQSAVNEPKDQVWLAYPATGSDVNNKILVLNYEDTAWSIYDIPMNCFGYYEISNDIRWEDLVIPWTECVLRWGDRDLQAGFPILLGGDLDGNIWQMDVGSKDADTTIPTAILTTGRLNPFVKQGRECRLGYIELLVDTDAVNTLTVQIYGGHQTGSPYLTTIVPMDDGRGQEKSWIKIPVGVTDSSHQMKITSTDYGAPAIHAVIYWAMPGARISR